LASTELSWRRYFTKAKKSQVTDKECAPPPLRINRDYLYALPITKKKSLRHGGRLRCGAGGVLTKKLTIGQSLAPAQLSHSYREFSLSRWTVAALPFFTSSFQYRIFFIAMASNSLASFFIFNIFARELHVLLCVIVKELGLTSNLFCTSLCYE
jgi:hypothetical protein